MSDAEDNQQSAPKAETLTIVVRDQQGGELQFKVKKNTKFGKIMTAYCARKSVSQDSVRFIYDGQRVREDATPEELDMEDGDSVDAVLEQVGGSRRHSCCQA